MAAASLSAAVTQGGSYLLSSRSNLADGGAVTAASTSSSKLASSKLSWRSSIVDRPVRSASATWQIRGNSAIARSHQVLSFSSSNACPSEASDSAVINRRAVRMSSSSSSSPSLTTEEESGSTTTAIQFIRGLNETTVPDVKLTRSRDGSSGMATFVFDRPTVFDSTGEFGEITGLFMIDSEGVLSSTDVSAKFVNGKPSSIEARYTMRGDAEWNRFMRFMERYAEENNLGFQKS